VRTGQRIFPEDSMASATAAQAGGARTGQLLLASAAEQGSAAHPYLIETKPLKGGDASRDLADLIHFLCALHGRHPGVIDHAANRVTDPEARRWVGTALEGFAEERGFLARLAAAAGPIPSTHGAADSDNALRIQRHAILMLAQSERQGCALGAAMALVLDWQALRVLMDAAAARFGVPAPACSLPDPAATGAVADAVGRTAAVERALLFGAQQILVQHYGLLDLLETRQQARAA
jgi:hypothetical protein